MRRVTGWRRERRRETVELKDGQQEQTEAEQDSVVPSAPHADGHTFASLKVCIVQGHV